MSPFYTSMPKSALDCIAPNDAQTGVASRILQVLMFYALSEEASAPIEEHNHLNEGLVFFNFLFATTGLSANARISTTFHLWTATIIMVVVFFLHLPITSTIVKVGMVRAWNGLGEIFDVERINLLGKPLGVERMSGSANNTSINDIFVSTNSSSSVYGTSYYHKEYYKVMDQHFGVMGLSDDD